MKTRIHPEYRPVMFRDRSGDTQFVTRSTISTDQTIEHDGQTLPLVDVEISAASHPFWTGRGRVMDNEGRVERFHRRYGVQV